MIALSVLCSPPCSGVFIAVVAGCRWTPFSPLSEVLPLPAAEAYQDSLVASLLGNELANRRSTLYPLTSLPLVGPVELVLGLVEALPFLGFDIPGILPGESYISLCALAE